MGKIKQFFWGLFLFIGGIGGLTPAAAEFGQTQWYDLPFAQVRMLSCLDGIEAQKMVVGGVQIVLKQGWTLQKPTLKPLHESDLLWIDYPIRPNPQETKVYTSDIFIPVLASPLLNPQLTFGVRGDLTACHARTGCLTLPIQIQLPLNTKSHNYTPYCAFIMDCLKQVPLPSGEKMSAIFTPLNEQEGRLSFETNMKINQAFLQNDSGASFRVLERHFETGVLTFRLLGKDLDKIKNWILITNQGVFRVPVLEKAVVPSAPQKSVPWSGLLWGGLWLFLGTPFFIFWGLAWPKNKNDFVVQSLQLAHAGTLVFILFCLGLAFYPKQLLLLNDPLYGGVSLILMGGSLLFPPKKVGLVLLLFWVWPKPYLWDTFKAFQGESNWLIVWGTGAVAWLWLICFIRIKGQKMWERFFHQNLKKIPFLINLFFLMPTVYLCVWMVCQLKEPEIPFQKTLSLNSGLTVVCAGQDCVPWVPEKNYPVHFISEDSPVGQAYLLRYHRPYGPLVMLLDAQEITVFPETITPKQFHSFILDWQNYHVLGTLAHQPTHFEDAPHAPSPNAK